VLYIELAGHYGIFEVWTHDVAIRQAGTWESKPDFSTYAIIVDCFSTPMFSRSPHPGMFPSRAAIYSMAST
jgi:hypothetical protein